MCQEGLLKFSEYAKFVGTLGKVDNCFVKKEDAASSGGLSSKKVKTETAAQAFRRFTSSSK